MSGKHLNVDMRFTADTSQAKSSIQELNRLLDKTLNQPTIGLGGSGISAEINKAKIAATELKVKLQDAMRTDGSLDLIKFNNSLQASGKTLGDYGSALSKLGSNGKQAFLQLTQSISTANISLERSNGMVNQLWTTLKNVARFQISSSVIHTLVGGISTAYNYAQDLNESLNNIRIVTNQSAEEMSVFADRANKAARNLSATTLDYTNASLIYYQQGLTDEEVAKRTETTLKLANVSRQSAETVSDQMTAIWNNFAKGSSNLEYYADVITALGAATASSSDEIATGVSKFAAVADTVGLSYEYATAALATLVAETRQSADTVGNGLRTLFTRFQSLKLGKTLEDGTNLTKYSEALATAGVNIKNQNGELKDMDQILKELGAKWETLNKDQQVALAQTVGGVRQYVNLIALMDNQDKFQNNLTIAEGSEGTLQKQAEVYAESWEAARDRVKAAAEAIYKSLIDDDFFIGVDNVIEKTLNGINSLIQAFGGLPGVLAVVGSAFFAIFGPQLSSSIDRIIERIKFMSGATQKNIVQMKKDANNELANMYANSTRPGDKIAHSAYQSQADYSNKILDVQLDKTKQLSEEEKNMLNLLQQQHNVLVQNTVEAGRQFEQAEKEFKLESAKIQYQTKNTVKVDKETGNSTQYKQAVFDDILKSFQGDGADAIQEIKLMISNVRAKALEQGLAPEKFLQNEGYTKTYIKAFTAMEKAANGVKDNATKSDASVKKLIDSFLKLNEANKKAFSSESLKEQIENLKKAAEQTAKIETTLKALNHFDGIDVQGSSVIKTKEDVEALSVALTSITSSIGEADEELKAAFGDGENGAFKAFKELQTVLETDTDNIEAIDTALQNFYDKLKKWDDSVEGEVNGYFGNINGLFEAADIDTAEAKMEKIHKMYEDLQAAYSQRFDSEANQGASMANLDQYLEKIKGEADTFGDSFTKVAQGITETFAVIETSKNLFKTLTDETTSSSEKVLAFGTAATTLAFSFADIFDGIQSVIPLFKSFGGIIADGSKALTMFITGLSATEVTLGAVLAVTGPLVIALGALAAAIYYQYEVSHKSRKAYEEQVEATKKAKEEFEKATETYNKLKTTVEDYTKARNSIDQLTEGTKEWRNAIEDTNAKALELIELWPDLASKFQIDNNGAIIFSDTDIEQAMRDSKIAEARSQLDYQRNDYISKQMAVTATRDSIKYSGFMGSTKYTDDQIDSMLKMFTDSPALSTFFNSIYKQMKDSIANNVVESMGTFYDPDNDVRKQYVEAYRERLEALNIDQQTLDQLFSGTTSDILLLFDALYEQRGVIEPLVDAQNALNDAQQSYSTELSTAILKINQALGAQNGGLASALMSKQLKDIDNNKNLSEDEKLIERNKIIDNVQVFINKAQELASQLDNNQEKINSVIQILLGNLSNVNLDNFNQQDLHNFNQTLSYNRDKLGLDLDELTKIKNDLLNQWNDTINDIFNSFPQTLQEQSRDLFDNLKTNEFITPDQFRKIGSLLSDALIKGDFSTFKNLEQIFKIINDNGGNVGKFANDFNSIKWETANVSDFITLLEEAGIQTDIISNLFNEADINGKNFVEKLREIIDAFKEGSQVNFEDMATSYKDVKEIVDKLSYEGDITSEDYQKLQAYSDDENYQQTLKDLFALQMNGDYKFFGDQENFSKLFNTEAIEAFQNQVQILAERISQLNEAPQYSDLNRTKVEDSTTFDYANRAQEMLEYLRAYQEATGKLTEEQQQQLSIWEQQAQANGTAKNILDEIITQVENIGDKDEDIKQKTEELIAEQEKYNDALNISKNHQWDADVTGQIEERAKFLREYGQELYGLSNAVLQNETKVRLLAEAFLRAEAAAKRAKDNAEKWTAVLNNTSTHGQDVYLETLQELENTYKDLLNISQNVHLSEGFLNDISNLELMQQALQGGEEGIQAYKDLMIKANEEIRQSFHDTWDEIIKQSISDFSIPIGFELDEEKLFADVTNMIDDLWSIFENLEPYDVGELIDNQEFINKLNEIINYSGFTLEQAKAFMSELTETMGFDAEVVEGPPKTEPYPSSFNYYTPPVYGTEFVQDVPDGAGGTYPLYQAVVSQPGKIETQTGTGEASGPAAFAMHVENVKMGVGSGGNINYKKVSNGLSGGYSAPKSSGGGSSHSPSSSSSSTKSPRSLTKAAKADVSARYHTIQEHLSDTERNLSEVSRNKERSYGETKLQYLNQEIELRKKAIQLQQQQTAEMRKYLDVDKNAAINALKQFGLNIQFDSNGVITNYKQLYDSLLDLENDYINQENSYNASGDEVPEYLKEQIEAIAEAKEAITQYETTLNGLEDALTSTAQAIDELNDALLEQVTTKVDFKLDINNDEAKMLDYYMQKYSDDIYSAAEAMNILGQQAMNTFDKIYILQDGVNSLLSTRGMSLDAFENMGLLSENFSANDISQLRSWRDELINTNLTLLKMEQNVRQQIENAEKQIKSLHKSIRDTNKNIRSLEKQIKEAYEQIEQLKLEQDVAALEKINEKLTKQNELIKDQNDLFNRYSNVLQTYKDITNLMGKAVNRNQEKLIDDLNNALLHNSKNTMAMAKRSMEDLAKQRSEIEKLLGKAINENNEEMVEKYKDILKQMDQEVQNYEQSYLTAWKNTMDQAQQIFETTVDNILNDFDTGLSGAFGSLNYLKQAFDRQSEIDGQYLKDYDKLYELNKMQRDLNKTLSNTTNADTRADLLALQKEINLYQQQGVQLSKYDIDALKAKIALQQSYNDLQVSQNAKNTVRLTRDAGGNWGYVYTANTDSIAKAEQSYEDKLRAYQKLNDDYLNELQNKVLEVQTTYRDYLKEILTDVSLSDVEREARIKELNKWLNAQQDYFDKQSQGAFKQQSYTVAGMTKYYKTFSQDVIDSWDKTKLATLTGTDSLNAYMNLWTGNSTTLLDNLTDALLKRREDLDEILQLSGTNILSWGETVQDTINSVGKASDDVNFSLISLSEVIDTSFAEAIDEYSKKIADVREQIDDYNDSLSDAHDALSDYQKDLAKANDQLSAAQSWQSQYADQVKAMIEQNERFIESLNRLITTLGSLNTAKPQYFDDEEEYLIEEVIPEEEFVYYEEPYTRNNKYYSNLNRFDTGGYTGEWGPEGRLAILDEKEEVFNAQDTSNLLEAATILRKIDMSALSMIASLGKIASPSIGETLQTIQQEVHIEASFPNANNHYEIEEAFNNLNNKAIQYVHRKDNL